jgi:GNAT superfamily N-acetyltransferase
MEFDANNSPFIRLPAPNENIIITPSRYSDGDAVIELLSDPRIYMNLAGPPYPYGQEEWDSWFPILEKASKDTLKEWREVENSRKEGVHGRQWVTGAHGAPVTAIREIDPVTGEQKFIGSIDATRKNWLFYGATDENKRKQEANDALEAGDPKIQWDLGCKSQTMLFSYMITRGCLTRVIVYLAPSHHRRGIMSAAMNALVHDFLVPYMNAHLITGSYFEYNSGSRKVFEKNGFVFQEIVPDFYELPESKAGTNGKKIGVGFMKWTRNV